MKKTKWMTYGAALLVTASLLGGCALEEEEPEAVNQATAFSKEVAEASEGWLYLNQNVVEAIPVFSQAIHFGGFPDEQTMVFYSGVNNQFSNAIYARINQQEDTIVMLNDYVVMTVTEVDMDKNRVKVKLQERIAE